MDDASLFGVSDDNAVVGLVHCIGTEPELLECSHSSFGWHGCGSQHDPIPDVAVSCYGMVFDL